MCNRKRLAVIGFCVLLGLTACGKTEESSRGSIGDAAESTEKETPTEGETQPAEAETEPAEPVRDAEGVFADAFANGEVENNGGYFVRVGDKVYYRLYNERGLHRTALFGGFLSGDIPTVPSTLMCYDLQTGQKEKVATVYGSGKLYAFEDGFFLGNSETNETYRIPLDGSQQSLYCEGTPQGVSEDGQLLAVSQYSWDAASGDAEHKEIILRDGEEVAQINAESILVFCGFAGNDAIFARDEEKDNGVSTSKEWILFSVNADGKQKDLGPIDVGASTPPEPEQILRDEEGAYLTFGFYDGSGHFLSYWVAVSAKPGIADSVEILEAQESQGDGADAVPKMVLTGPGEVEYYPVAGGEVGLSEGYYGDLVYYDSPFGATVLKENYISEEDANGTWDWGNFLLDAVAFEDTAFLITAYGERNERQDIGWRMAYDLIYMEYSVIPFDEEHLENGLPKETVSLEFLTSTGWGDSVVALEDLVGSWKLDTYETEGYSGNAEEDSLDTRLVIDQDGSAYLEEKVDGQQHKEVLTLQESDEEGIYVFLTNGGRGDDVMQIDIIDCDGEILETSVTWWYSDGVPGGSTWIFDKE